MFAEAWSRSLRDPEGFWGEAAREIVWERPPERILDGNRWFTGGVLNTCHNALDVHCEKRGEARALIYDSPVTGRVETFSYAQLRDRVARFAGMLAREGVTRGDRVILYMPMVPEAVVGMLACARIGAIHSVVFGGFAPKELAARIDDAQPKVILSASCGIEVSRVIAYKPLLDQAITMARHKPARCIILQRAQLRAELGERDLEWDEGGAPADCVPMAATDPLYILYTSGTTGKPKGIVRDQGGHAVALKWSMQNVYGVGEGELLWAASDIGWQVGHSYIVYGPLLRGATAILYEGKPVGTPDAGAYWRVCQQHGVKVLFTAPTGFRAIKREDPDGKLISKYDLSKLKALFLAGERCEVVSGLMWKIESATSS